MKKVLFVVPSLETGGVERELITIANALVENSYDVTILNIFGADTLKDSLDKRVKYIYKPLKRFFVRQKLPVIKDKYYGMCMWETRTSARKLYKYYLGNSNFDVEIAFFRGLPLKIISGSNNKKSKKIVWVHTDFKYCKDIDFGFNSRKEVVEAYSRFSKIICVSQKVKESFNEVIGCEDRTEVIYNAISIDEILQKSKAECPFRKMKTTAVSVGRLVEPKAYDRLLCAVNNLNSRGYDFELWIVGEGNCRSSLENYIVENNLNNVRLVGCSSNPYSFLNRSDFYICSSLWEGFNLAVVEALTCSLPVVSTDCTGPSEILEKGKYGLIVDNNVEGLIYGIQTMLKDEKLRADFSNKALQRAGAFDISNIVSNLINLLEEK